jgi:hypothetical protein
MPSLGSGTQHHVFVDESARPGRYLLTAVFVPTRNLALVTRQVREALPQGNRRTHMSAEGDRRRRILLRAYSKVGAVAHVVVASYRGGDDQSAREACLAAILARSQRCGAAVLVLDTRGPHRDALDRRFIASTLRASAGPSVQYTHRGSRSEPLLSLPDAIGWAVGAGGMWRRLIEPIVSEVMQVDP